MKKVLAVFISTQIFILLGIPLSSAAQGGDPSYRAAIKQAKTEAATLLRQKDGKNAYEMYSRLLREEPDDDAINLGLARAAMLANRPNQAIMAYLRLLEKYPQERELYKEIAQAYMAIDDRDTARQYMEISKQENITETLDTLEKRYARTQIHGKLRAGVMYDSNANQGPSSNRMNLGNYLIEFDNVKSVSSMGMYLGGQVDIAHRLEQASPWWLVSDAHVMWRGNANSDMDKTHSRESQWARVSGGIRHLDSQSLFDLRLKGETFDYGFYQRVMALGPEMLYVLALRPDFQLMTRLGVDRRVYSRDSTRNGTYGYFGGYGRYFFGKDNHEIMAGIRYLGGDANVRSYSYNGYETSFRLRYKLDKQLEILPSISYTRENYHGPATVLEKDRKKNRIFRTGIGLTYYFTKDWSMEALYQYTRSDSNSALYDYKQHVISLGISTSF